MGSSWDQVAGHRTTTGRLLAAAAFLADNDGEDNVGEGVAEEGRLYRDLVLWDRAAGRTSVLHDARMDEEPQEDAATVIAPVDEVFCCHAVFDFLCAAPVSDDRIGATGYVGDAWDLTGSGEGAVVEARREAGAGRFDGSVLLLVKTASDETDRPVYLVVPAGDFAPASSAA